MSFHHGWSARRLCCLVDQMNVLPGKLYLSAMDIVWLGQNKELLRRSGTEAGAQEASKLIAWLLPEAEQIIKEEEEDRRSTLVTNVVFTVIAVAFAGMSIYGLTHGQPWSALLLMFFALAILAITFVIGPNQRLWHQAYMHAVHEDLGESWSNLELLTAD